MRLLGRLTSLRKCHRVTAPAMSTDAESSGLPLPQVLGHLESFAPLSLAELWDNVGALVMPTAPLQVKKALLTIDLTEDVVKEAVDREANLIIAYHPPIFAPLKRITSGKWKERIVATCLENRIAVFSPHTSWDAVSPLGLTDWLASTFDFERIEPLAQSKGQLDKAEFSHQLTVFCSQTDAARCRDIVRLCRAEIIKEVQLESVTTISALVLSRFLSELDSGLTRTNAHFSICERTAFPPKGCGSGRFGTLKSPIKLSEAVNKIKALVKMPQIRLALQRGKTLDSTVQSVVVVAGSGGSLLRSVRADLYVTGEMLHHDLLEANHSGASVILVNHSDSERGFLSNVAPVLADKFENKVNVMVAETDKDPIIIV